MDQEMIAYLDAHFREANQRAEVLYRRMEALQQQMENLHQETTQQIASLREETARRFEQVDSRFERLEEVARHTLVLLEDLRDEIHLIAEGYIGLNERLERLQSETSLTFSRFTEWIEPYYKPIDGRLRALENASDLRQMDILDAVRKMLARPPVVIPSFGPPPPSD